MKRSRSSALADLSVNSESPLRPETPACASFGSGNGALDFTASADNRSQRIRKGYATCSPSASDSHNLTMVWAAACSAGEHTVVHFLKSMSFPLNERVELGILELNMLMRIHKHSIPTVRLKASHQWTRAEPAKVVSLIEHAICEPRVTDLVKHLVTVAFPACVSLAAAQHVFAVPTFLAQWQRKNGQEGNVRVLEVTMCDASGRQANAVYFPLAS